MCNCLYTYTCKCLYAYVCLYASHSFGQTFTEASRYRYIHPHEYTHIYSHAHMYRSIRAGSCTVAAATRVLCLVLKCWVLILNETYTHTHAHTHIRTYTCATPPGLQSASYTCCLYAGQSLARYGCTTQAPKRVYRAKISSTASACGWRSATAGSCTTGLRGLH